MFRKENVIALCVCCSAEILMKNISNKSITRMRAMEQLSTRKVRLNKGACHTLLKKQWLQAES
jgi:hypothetical protein